MPLLYRMRIYSDSDDRICTADSKNSTKL